MKRVEPKRRMTRFRTLAIKLGLYVVPSVGLHVEYCKREQIGRNAVAMNRL